jgi:hypothetical protein
LALSRRALYPRAEATGFYGGFYNIQLTQQGQDARQAQVLSLSTLISESAGVLQTMKINRDRWI